MKLLTLAVVASLALVSSVAIAAPVGGQKSGHDTIQSGYVQTYTLALRRGEPTVIVVAGNDASDLDCYLYDDGGNEVDRDDDNTDVCRLEVKPLWTGIFTLKIVNVGERTAQYAFRAL